MLTRARRVIGRLDCGKLRRGSHDVQIVWQRAEGLEARKLPHLPSPSPFQGEGRGEGRTPRLASRTISQLAVPSPCPPLSTRQRVPRAIRFHLHFTIVSFNSPHSFFAEGRTTCFETKPFG